MAFGMMALAGAGLAVGLLGAANQAEATEDAARFNAAAAKEDIKLVKTEENQKLRNLREAGARQVGAVKAAGAASGVKVSAGSMLDAIVEQASVNAQNEFLLGFESRATQARIMQAAKSGSVTAANQAAGQRLSGIGQGLTGTAQIMAMKG